MSKLPQLWIIASRHLFSIGSFCFPPFSRPDQKDYGSASFDDVMDSDQKRLSHRECRPCLVVVCSDTKMAGKCSHWFVV